jgi:hypothetical protein
MDGSVRGLILRYYLGIRLEVLRKTMKSLNHGSHSPGRDFNVGPAEYQTDVLTNGPLRSILLTKLLMDLL